ncbi:MAG TPA: glycosyltransferase family 1 protein [Gaiellaceae bacterium]|nr:glycosyltransferase family 1 protein [Gaiellaceae bacterium]
MRVGLNVLHLVPRETGGGELYVRRLIPALLEAGDDLQLVVFTGREATPSFAAEPWASDVELVQVPVRSRSRPRRVLAEQTLLPRAAHKARVHLLHNVQNTAPAVPRVAQVTTILDVIYKRHPETHAGILAAGVALLVPLAARRSRRILTLSEAAKDDIVHYLHVDPERIDVTPLGPGLGDDVEPIDEAELRGRHQLGDAPIILTVSAKRPHKNLERLLQAVALVEADPQPVLVAPGYETVFESELKEQAGKRVKFLGWVDDEELEGLYRMATCFVFPSLAEGFGLPVLEAMVRGIPVACSRIGPLEEVAGEAALYFDAEDTKDIARALETLLADGDLRGQLAQAGRQRAEQFNWARTAEATISSYERALAQ